MPNEAIQWVTGETLAVPHSAGTMPPANLAPAGATDCHIHIFDRRFPRQAVLEHTAAQWGTVAEYRLFQRCVWGTDWPHTGVKDAACKPDGAQLFDRLSRWVPDAASRYQVLVTNPEALYWAC